MSAFQPPAQVFRDPTSFARAATVALMLAAAMHVGAGLFVVDRLAAGDTLSFSISDRGTIAARGAFPVFQWVSFVISTLSYVTWLVWQYRVHTNARLFAHDLVPTGPGWGVLCWFVPFVNFVKPYLILREIRAASVPRRRGGRWVTRLWWGAWLGGGILSSAAMVEAVLDVFNDLRGSIMPRLFVVELDEGTLHLIVAAELLLIIAAVFAVIIIREVTQGQTALGRVVADAASAVPTRLDVR